MPRPKGSKNKPKKVIRSKPQLLNVGQERSTTILTAIENEQKMLTTQLQALEDVKQSVLKVQRGIGDREVQIPVTRTGVPDKRTRLGREFVRSHPNWKAMAPFVGMN